MGYANVACGVGGGMGGLLFFGVWCVDNVFCILNHLLWSRFSSPRFMYALLRVLPFRVLLLRLLRSRVLRFSSVSCYFASASIKQAVQPEEKARAKDRRSAKTGVRAGGRAPSNTVQGDADVSADPMTYALQQVGD